MFHVVSPCTVGAGEGRLPEHAPQRREVGGRRGRVRLEGGGLVREGVGLRHAPRFIRPSAAPRSKVLITEQPRRRGCAIAALKPAVQNRAATSRGACLVTPEGWARTETGREGARACGARPSVRWSCRSRGDEGVVLRVDGGLPSVERGGGSSAGPTRRAEDEVEQATWSRVGASGAREWPRRRGAVEVGSASAARGPRRGRDEGTRAGAEGRTARDAAGQRDPEDRRHGLGPVAHQDPTASPGRGRGRAGRADLRAPARPRRRSTARWRLAVAGRRTRGPVRPEPVGDLEEAAERARLTPSSESTGGPDEVVHQRPRRRKSSSKPSAWTAWASRWPALALIGRRSAGRTRRVSTRRRIVADSRGPWSCWQVRRTGARRRGRGGRASPSTRACSGVATRRQGRTARAHEPGRSRRRSASWNCTAWNAAIGSPDWTRPVTCSTASSTARSTCRSTCQAVSVRRRVTSAAGRRRSPRRSDLRDGRRAAAQRRPRGGDRERPCRVATRHSGRGRRARPGADRPHHGERPGPRRRGAASPRRDRGARRGGRLQSAAAAARESASFARIELVDPEARRWRRWPGPPPWSSSAAWTASTRPRAPNARLAVAPNSTASSGRTGFTILAEQRFETIMRWTSIAPEATVAVGVAPVVFHRTGQRRGAAGGEALAVEGLEQYLRTRWLTG